jgi:hypothetical protein
MLSFRAKPVAQAYISNGAAHHRASSSFFERANGDWKLPGVSLWLKMVGGKVLTNGNSDKMQKNPYSQNIIEHPIHELDKESLYSSVLGVLSSQPQHTFLPDIHN